MSSSKVFPRFKGISLRIMLWFSSFMAIAVISICMIVYMLLGRYLLKADHELIREKSVIIERYLANDMSPGRLETLKHILAADHDVYVGIMDKDGSLLFSILPKNVKGKGEIEYVIHKSQVGQEKGWSFFLIEAGRPMVDMETTIQMKLMSWGLSGLVYFLEEDIFEMKTSRLPSGAWLHIGKSAVERQKKLMNVREIAFFTILFFIITGIVMSYLLSKGILRPVRKMIRAIDEIEKGKLESQVELSGTGDEIDQLASRFNRLTRSNHKLITSMRDTLDNVAHDLMTPLTRIMNSVEESILKDDPHVLKKALEDTMENTALIRTLLNTIMDLTEAENGLMYLKQETVNVQELLNQVKMLYLPVLEDSEIELETQCPSTLILKGDVVRLRQAITNLVDNAIKFSPKGGLIEIKASEEKSFISISVKDHGPGIPLEEQGRIWERLYRGSQSRLTAGLGIGLSLVKAIVVAHHGHITLDSVPGEGATFHMTLPSTGFRP